MGTRKSADKPRHKLGSGGAPEPRLRRAANDGQEQKRIKV